MVEVVKYNATHKAVWDTFVAASKNGTFILCRDYMEYHADRFTDHSLLFYRKNKLIALLPANEAGIEIHSHGGLTYGGVICDYKMKVAVMLEVFEAMQLYFRKLGFNKIRYKAIPHIFHQAPAEEDLYALFRFGATLYRRDVSSAIELSQKTKYSRKRKWEVVKAKKGNLLVQKSKEISDFMIIEEKLLQEKYGKRPTHTTEEMVYLAERFPNFIKLYAAYEEEVMIAGIVVYETATAAHSQYIGATARGYKQAALDQLTDYILTKAYTSKRYFSFGISTEQEGHYLNEGLISNKESYGARAVVHDFYELTL